MRRALFTTVSAMAVCLYTVSAQAADEQAPPSRGLDLRGALDVSDRHTQPPAPAPDSTEAAPIQERAQTAPPKKRNSLALTAASEPTTITPFAGYKLSAIAIAGTSFDWTGDAHGKGAVIGIVDSGIDLDHPEFTGRVLTGTCFGGYSAICTVAGAMKGGDPGVYSAQTTHGTHVAGIAAGATVGLANQAKILPVKVCDTYSGYCPGDPDAGIVWASQHGAKIINLSLGGPGLYTSDIAAAAKAIANGALLVVAAGNAGNSHPVSGYLGGAALKNGVRGGLIVVGATGTNNVLASFSQTPGSTCETYSGKKYCMRDYFVVAPGQGISSSVGGGKYANMSGTSMATPFVSGVAALIKGQWPTLTPFQVADIIFRTTIDLGTPGSDNIYGRGAVDVTAAMTPAGGSSVLTVTSGTTTTTAKGTKNTLSTASLGVLSAPLQASSLLKSVEVVDEYGRDFNVDMTKLARAEGFSLANMLNDPFRDVTPLAIASSGAFGAVSMSGFVERPDLPQALGADAALTGSALNTTEHVAISLMPSDRLSLDYGHNIAMSGYFNAYDLRAGRGEAAVFLSGSALNSPYLALADGGNFAGAGLSPIDGVRVRMGYASVGESRQPLELLNGRDPYDPANRPAVAPRREASSVVASLSWDFSSWGGLGLTAATTKEAHSVLGGYTAGAFDVADAAGTSSVGISARMGLGGGWTTTFAYSQGTTRLGLAQGGLFTNVDPLSTRAYGVALSRRNLFGDDTLGVALSRPLHIFKGGATLHAATGIDENQNLIYSTEHLSLAAPVPETDFELGYATRLMDGAVTLQGSAAYQMDVLGQPGTDAVTALGRASFHF